MRLLAGSRRLVLFWPLSRPARTTEWEDMEAFYLSPAPLGALKITR